MTQNNCLCFSALKYQPSLSLLFDKPSTRLRISLFSKQKKKTFDSDLKKKNWITNVRFFKQLYKSPTKAGFFTEGT